MKLRKQAKDSVETRKAFLIERDDRHKRIIVGIRLQNLQAKLPANAKKMVEAGVGVTDGSFRQDRRFLRAAQDLRNLLQ
ncbi:hypothetical protein, partial [Halomonas marinisediminis]|uniref:hypothetical protein n=1 Tax=Halomonas marinisediminis TaxID=2546095 RepID=UPI001F0D473C